MLVKYGSYEVMFVFLGSLVYGDGLYFPSTDTYVTYEFFKKVRLCFAC